MSTPPKPDPARGWQALEALSAADDAKWLETATDEEVERRMQDEGVHVSQTPSADDLLARMRDRAPVADQPAAPANERHVATVPESRPRPGESRGRAVQLPVRRKNARLWVGALALAAGVALVLAKALSGSDDVAGGRHYSEFEKRRWRANALRDEAFVACDAKAWTTCEAKLDEAKSIDPGGEDNAGVVAARKALVEAGTKP